MMGQRNATILEKTVPSTIEAKIDRVMRALADSLTVVLEELPGSPQRPQELARLLKLNKTLSSCLHKAMRTADPFAAAHLMPGPEALRMFVRAAARKSVDPASIAAAEEAVSAFDQLIRRDAGNRDGLEAIISANLPDARKKFEMANKQAAFKGIANLKGVMMEVYCITYLVHPGEDTEQHDLAMIVGMRGLRRVRPGAVVQVSNRDVGPDAEERVSWTLDGKRVESMDGLLLKQHCSSPLPKLDVHQAGVCARYIIADQAFGPDSAVDLVFAEVRRHTIRRYRRLEGGRTAGVSADVEQPAKMLVFNFLLHEAVWPGCEPELRIYDTIERGSAYPNDPARDIDLLDLAESIEFLGHGPAKFRAVEIPNYPEMLRHVCGKLDWDAEKFRGYRCRIQYPFYGSQVCMVFDPPERLTS